MPKTLESFRMEVLRTFNKAYGYLAREIQTQKQSGYVAPELSWLRNTLFSARTHPDIVRGKSHFINQFRDAETGQEFQQPEGVPIEGLIDFLNRHAQTNNSDKNTEMRSLAAKLHDQSVSYISIPERLEDSKFHARVQQEAYFISQDQRNTGRDFDNWILAEKTIKERRELEIPPLAETTPRLPKPVVRQTRLAVSEPIEPQPDEKSHQPPVKRSGIGKRYIPPVEETDDEQKRLETPIILPKPQKIEAQRAPEPPATKVETPTKSEQTPAKSPEKPAQKTPEQPKQPEIVRQLEDREYSLEEMFQAVPGAPVKQNNPYYIEQVPDTFQVADIKALELPIPYYVNIDLQADNTLTTDINPKSDRLFQNKPKTNPRYQHALRAVPESELFGVIALNAPTPEAQARLFKLVTKEILEIHQKDPQLITKWIEAQATNQDINSLKVFQLRDIMQINPDTGQPMFVKKPADEKLTAFNFHELTPIWRQRMDVLSAGLAKNRLRPKHIKWINYLSHSIDVSTILNEISQNQNLPTPEKETLKNVEMGGFSTPAEYHTPETNEDAYFYDPESLSAGVFDGVGGVANGKTASSLAKEATRQILKQSKVDINTMANNILPSIEEILSSTKTSGTEVGLTTASMIKLEKTPTGQYEGVIGQVGDSRIYQFSPSSHRLIQLTRDHGVVENFVDTNDMPLPGKETDYYTQRNQITDALGGSSSDSKRFSQETYRLKISAKQGDIFVLTTDGIHDNLTRPEIEKIVQEAIQAGNSAEAISQKLVAEARKVANQKRNRSKDDDMTAVVVSIPT